MLRRAAFVASGIAIVVACGSDYDSQDDTSPDAGAGFDATPPPSGTSSGSPATDSGPGVFKEQEDLACEGRTADDAFDVFVSAMQGVDGADCGSRDAACKTVQAGVARAYALGKPKVVIAKGTYVESIPLDGGLTLEGGWEVSGTTWTASCNADHSSLAVIQATTDTTVKATRGASVLRFLTLKSKEKAAPGESLYGLVATGAGVKVALADSAIVVAAGGPGADGAPGSGLTEPPASCPGADGGAGSAGASGDAGALGTIGPNGFVAAIGSNGLIGKPGLDGIPGNPMTVTFRPCEWTSSPATCKQTAPSKQQTVDGGAPGCGGRAGAGGSGGSGGGSSIGILAVDALIVTYGGTVTTGGGGAGGNGGKGVAGTLGTAPEPSPTFHYDSATTGFCNGPSRAICEAPLDVTGAAGGAGGSGGNGGAGGGGAGGWSIAYVKLGLSAVLASTTTVFTTGSAGAGGAPNGAPGLRQQQWP